MIRYIIGIILIAGLSFYSCNEDKFTLHSLKSGVGFHGLIQKRTDGSCAEREYRLDSLHYSFMYEARPDQLSDTIFVRMDLTGLALKQQSKYEILVDTSSTAKQGLHYKLPDSYLFAANAYQDSFPLIIYRENLPVNEGVSLKLMVNPTPDLSVTIDEKQEVQLYISNLYYKPWFWDLLLNSSLGYYHPLKLKKVEEVIGTLSAVKWRCKVDLDRWEKAMVNVRSYFMTNEISDEEGNRVTVPGM